MTNLEEFNKVNTEYIRLIKHISDISNINDPSDNAAYNRTVLNIMMSSYLPLIAKSLAIIADNMSEEKED